MTTLQAILLTTIILVIVLLIKYLDKKSRG